MLQVIDFASIHEHADFATGGDSVRFRHTLEALRRCFQFRETFDVRFHRFSASTWASTGDGIGRCDDEGFRTFDGDVFVVCCDTVNDFRTEFESLRDLDTDLYVRAGDFVIECFANVMEETTFDDCLYIGTDFFRHHASEVCHFNRVLENVLTVARAEAESPDDLQ